jgi:hypothetical protein
MENSINSALMVVIGCKKFDHYKKEEIKRGNIAPA